jgi:hypothetical protein
VLGVNHFSYTYPDYTRARALLIGVIALPGSFLAKLMVERMPVHVHSAILDAVVIAGGATMAVAAFAG